PRWGRGQGAGRRGGPAGYDPSRAGPGLPSDRHLRAPQDGDRDRLPVILQTHRALRRRRQTDPASKPSREQVPTPPPLPKPTPPVTAVMAASKSPPAAEERIDARHEPVPQRTFRHH